MLVYPLIQVAGISGAAEARMLQDCGVRCLGFPLHLPVHQADLTEAETAAVIQSLDPGTVPVLITYLSDAEAVERLCRSLSVRTVQLHGDMDPSELRKLKTLSPSLTVLKSLVVGARPAAVLETLIREASPWVDGFLTDTFDPATGAWGATGRIHDWNISQRLVARSPHPIVLAGGLTPENVGQAIATVRPAGVDAHTGLEDASGRKCPDKVFRFVSAARHAFTQINATPST